MNLSDKEILELNDLCSAVVDGTLTEAQRARLETWFATSDAARRAYVRAMDQSASLHHYASEMHAEAPDASPKPAGVFHALSGWWVGALATAACAVGAMWLANRSTPLAPGVTSPAEEFVARLTGAKGCQWVGDKFQTGDTLRKGQHLELAGGFAEITFDSGAQLVLEGPAILDVTSAWDTTLRRGTLRATVPPEAIGFTIANEAVDVVDLGTEFTIIADGKGAADVLVLKGEVEATPQQPSVQESILLREYEARRFAHGGMSDVSDSASKFAHFNQPLALERPAQEVSYVHWSFDEAAENRFPADAFDTPLDGFAARIEPAGPAATRVAAAEGRWNRGLRFDGRLFARAGFRGLSASTPRTIAFWVRIPEDAQLSSAYAMVAWWAESEGLGARPVHISWNRNPNEGQVGVLRTDYSGGFALGSSSLRDGRWHHLAVVFIPARDANTPAEVKQYVDGRLEGEGHPSPPLSAGSTESNPGVRDTLWLGCRLGDTGPRKNRFRGDMDELCVASRVLEPREIVQLMKEGRPLTTTMAKAPE